MTKEGDFKKAQEQYYLAVQTRDAFHAAVREIVTAPPERGKFNVLYGCDPKTLLRANMKQFDYTYVVTNGDQKLIVLAESSKDGLSFGVQIHSPIVDVSTLPERKVYKLVTEFQYAKEEEENPNSIFIGHAYEPIPGYLTAYTQDRFTLETMPQLTDKIQYVSGAIHLVKHAWDSWASSE